MDSEMTTSGLSSRAGEFVSLLLNGRHLDMSMVGALLRCMSLEELSELLLEVIEYHPDLARSIADVLKEREIASWTSAQEQLAKKLGTLLPNLPHNRRSTAFYCLGSLVAIAPPMERQLIISDLLRSRFVAGRRKGLSLITEEDVPNLETEILVCLTKHRDKLAAKVAAYYFHPELAYLHRHLISEIWPEGWLLGRLYSRISPTHPECLDELLEIDSVTYAYVCAKFGVELSDTECMKLIELNRTNERFGLLVWAFGKLGKWEVLMHIAKLPYSLPEPDPLVIQRILERRSTVGTQQLPN